VLVVVAVGVFVEDAVGDAVGVAVSGTGVGVSVGVSVPLGTTAIAISRGLPPTMIVSSTVLVTASMTDTVPLRELAT
jgi:hypothetical protein